MFFNFLKYITKRSMLAEKFCLLAFYVFLINSVGCGKKTEAGSNPEPVAKKSEATAYVPPVNPAMKSYKVNPNIQTTKAQDEEAKQDEMISGLLEKNQELDKKRQQATEDALSSNESLPSQEHFYKCGTKLTYASYYYDTDGTALISDPYPVGNNLDSSKPYASAPFAVMKGEKGLLYAVFLTKQDGAYKVYYSTQNKANGPWNDPQLLDAFVALPSMQLSGTGVSILLYDIKNYKIIEYQEDPSKRTFVQKSSKAGDKKAFEDLQKKNNEGLLNRNIILHTYLSAEEMGVVSPEGFKMFLILGIQTLVTFGTIWPASAAAKSELRARVNANTSAALGQSLDDKVKQRAMEQLEKIKNSICP